MEDSLENKNANSRITGTKIFTVPNDLEEVKSDLIFNTNSSPKTTKEQIINQAFKFHGQGNISKAAKYYEDFINQGFNDHRVFSNYGSILKNLGKLKKAEVLQRKAIEIQPDYANAYSNLGNILRELGQLKEAEILTRKAIELKPDFANAYSNLGNILKDIGKLNEAELSHRKAIELNPNSAEAYSNLGSILKDLGTFKEAEILTRKAIELKPDFANAYINLGNILRTLGKLKEAEKATRKAIILKQDDANAHATLGSILSALNTFTKAKNSYEKAIELDPKNPVIVIELIYILSILSDWEEVEKRLDNLTGLINKDNTNINPSKLLHIEDNPDNELNRAIKYSSKKYKTDSNKIPYKKKEKIHIGYFSADFRAHPVMYLTYRLLKSHDTSAFNIYIYSFVTKEDQYTKKLKNNPFIFRSIYDKSDMEVVKLARDDELDIAIDLMGLTKNNRLEIFSHRIAPIQINYLGYPGTSGCKEIDYIIGDKVLIPDNYEKYYSEKIIHMPNSYMPFDNQTKISKKIFLKREFKIPETSFVLAAFHNNYKITKKEIYCWSRILKKIPFSIIWISEMTKEAKNNLLGFFNSQGVKSERIHFCKRLESREEHLARHSCADLFLDTFNYNGHSTSIDSLWSGLPVITLLGQSFSARVSSSLLKALNLTELIATDINQYENIIVELAHDKNKLKKLKHKLKVSRTKSPLFDSISYTKEMECILKQLVSELE